MWKGRGRLYRIQRAELFPTVETGVTATKQHVQDFRHHRFGDLGGVQRQSGHQFLGD